jgi:hypothetical protein
MTVDSDDGLELSRVSKTIYEDSNNPQLNRLVEEEEETAVYRPNKRFVGWTVFDKEDFNRGRAHVKKRRYSSQEGEPAYIRINKEQNVVGTLGPIGGGKTVFLRGFSNRGYFAGVRGIHLADVKGDMQSNNYKGGVQKEIENLRKKESPQPVPTKMLMPLFIKEYQSESVGTFNQFFQFEFDDLTQKDFTTMMPTDTDNKRAKVDEIFDLMSNGELESFDAVLDWLEDQDMNYSNRNSLQTAIKNMKRNGVVGNDNQVDVPQLLAENEYFLSVNMTGHDDISNGFPQMYVGKNVRDIWKAKKHSSGVIPKNEPLEMYLDEAHEFLEDDNVAEKWIMKAVKKNRYLKFRLIWATHFLTDFDGYSGSDKPNDLPELVRQTKHFVVSPGFGADSLRVVLKHLGLWRSRDYDKWREVFALMNELRDRGIYAWLYLNGDGQWCVFENASSSANHG